MKISLKAKDFTESINWVTKGLDVKDESSFTSLYVDKEGRVFFIASSSQFYKKSSVESISVKSDGEFHISFNPKFIQKLSGALSGSDDEITIEKSDKKNSQLKVSSPHGNFTVPVMRAKPETNIKLTTIAEVSEQEFFEALTSVAPIANSSSDSAEAVGTVSLAIGDSDDGDESITFMATDAFSLGEVVIDCSIKKKDFDKDEINLDAILIPKASALMIPAPKSSINSMDIVFDSKGKRFGYSFTDGRVAIFGLDRSNPIIYKKMKDNIVKLADAHIDLSLDALKKSIGTISSLAWEEVDIRLVLNKDNKVLEIRDNTDSNSIEVPIDEMSYDGDSEVDLKFMRDVIKSAFSPISSSQMRLNFTSDGNTKACVFRPILEDGSVSETVLSFAVVRR